MPERRQVMQRLLDRRRRPHHDGGPPPNWPIDEDRRFRAESIQLEVQTARGQHDVSVHVLGQGADSPHLLVGVLAGVHQNHLQARFPGCAFDRAHKGGEVGIGDVGDDHRDVVGPAGDESPSCSVWHEAQLADGVLDAFACRRRHHFGAVQGSGDRRCVDAGQGRHIENGDSLPMPHARRTYTTRSGHLPMS
jgi:hypothetical protein